MPRLILAVILCFLPLVSVQATRPVLKIGLTSTTCGNTAGIAINQVQSLRWWANDTNARGGITVNGTVYDVDFVIYNDAIDPELVSILYDRLVNVDQVDLLMGPFGTNLFRAAPYAQQYKIPMMNIGDFTYYSSSNAPNGTFGGWLFSSVPNPLRLVSPCLEILKTKDVSTLASAWTTEVADTSLNLLNFLAAGNAQMAVLSAPANIKTDLSNVDDVIDSLEKFDAPAFSGGMFTATQNAELIDAFIRRKYLPAARIFWVGPAFDAFRTAAGWRGASLLFPDVWNPSLNFTDPEYGNSEGFFNAYKAGTGREPDSTDIMAMHGATAFKLALERANSLDGDAIRIALSELNDEAWMGIANFSGAFQQTTSEYYCFQLNSTGRGIKPVSLNARARADLVYPAEISIPSGYYPSNSKRKLALGLGLGLGLGVVVLVLLGAFFYWLVVKYQIVFIPKSEDKGEW